MSFDVVDVILEQLYIRTADYYKRRDVPCNEKTIVNVTQNMPLNIWGHLTFFTFILCLSFTYRLAK